MKSEMPDVKSDIAIGDFSKITDWFKKNVYPYGKLISPEELLLEVTNESVNPDLFVEYLEEKYKEIYVFE